jgi:hypothetical protein
LFSSTDKRTSRVGDSADRIPRKGGGEKHGQHRAVIRPGLLALLAALVLASCGGGDGGGGKPEAAPAPAPAAGAAELTDVAGVLDLRAAFNRDSGRPRLLLLLSPT